VVTLDVDNVDVLQLPAQSIILVNEFTVSVFPVKVNELVELVTFVILDEAF
jgi:hypothetical protein